MPLILLNLLPRIKSAIPGDTSLILKFYFLIIFILASFPYYMLLQLAQHQLFFFFYFETSSERRKKSYIYQMLNVAENRRHGRKVIDKERKRNTWGETEE